MTGDARQKQSENTSHSETRSTRQSNALLNPYVGPRPFHSSDRLFGREREIRTLINLLVAERILLLYSPSGAGKTSLLQAALIPALAENGFRVLPPIRLGEELPSYTPPHVNRFVFSTLLMLEDAHSQDQPTPLEQLATMDIPTYLRRPATFGPSNQEIVLIFDQFEEILTTDPTDRPAKQVFFNQIGTALQDRRIWALFVMREDYLAALDPFLNSIPNRLKHTFRLDLLSPGAAREAIQGPALAVGVSFTDEAAVRLIDDLRRVMLQRFEGTIEQAWGNYIEPVQLQVVCRRLWDKTFVQSLDYTHRSITLEDVQNLGDVDTALADFYAEVVRQAASHGASEWAIRAWFDKQLITPEGRRNQVIHQPESSGGLANAVIAWLVDAYLVRAEERRGTVWYELAHDRLISPIRHNNHIWREEHLHSVQRLSLVWNAEGRPNRMLLRGRMLRQASQWVVAHNDRLTNLDRDFLVESRRATSLRFFTGIAATLALMLAVLIGFFYLQAQQNAQITRSLQLTTLARDVGDHAPQRSVLLALEAGAAATDDNPTTEIVQRSIRDVLLGMGGTPLRGHTASLVDVAFSPDGRYLATASEDDTARLWDVHSPEHPVAVLRPHSQAVHALLFSADSRRLATASEDGTVRLWDVAEPQHVPIVLRGHTLDVVTLAFSPDGRYLATGSLDQTVRLWQLGYLDQAPAIVLSHTGRLHTLAFSPDSRWLASGTEAGTVSLWDMSTPALTPVSLTSDRSIRTLAFSPDGRQLAFGGEEGTVWLWEISDPPEQAIRLYQHNQSVQKVVFSARGSWLASGSLDGTVRLWKLGSPTQAVLVLPGNDLPVTTVAFSGNERWVIAGSNTGLVQMWSVDTPEQLPVLLRGHEGLVTATAFSPDSQWFVTASTDQTARLWRAGAPESNPIVLREHVNLFNNPVRAIAFALDGQRLVTGADDGITLLWDVRHLEVPPVALSGPAAAITVIDTSPDGRQVVVGRVDGTLTLWQIDRPIPVTTTLQGYDAAVAGVRFSPTGRWLASASIDGTARLWQFGGGNPRPVMLSTHDESMHAIAFSPDEQWLAIGSAGGIVRLWRVRDVVTDPEVLQAHTEDVITLGFSPDGRWLATGSADKTVRLWDVAAPERESKVLRGHDDAIITVIFSSDSQLMVTGSRDSTVRLWPLSALDRGSVKLSGARTELFALALSSDPKNQWLATGNGDGTVWLSLVQASDVASLACTTAGRNLSLEEWQQFIGSEALYTPTCPQLPLPATVYQSMLARGEIDEALRRYNNDRQREPSIEPSPAWLVRMAGQMLSQVTDEWQEPAMVAYQQAVRLDPQLNSVDADALNTICSLGDVDRYAEDLIHACNRAVALAPEYGNAYFNRAIVRMQLDDLKGAAEDLRKFIPWATGRPNGQAAIEQVRSWLNELDAGHSPLKP